MNADPRRTSICNINELYQKFKEVYPNFQVSLTKFSTIRPEQCILLLPINSYGYFSDADNSTNKHRTKNIVSTLLYLLVVSLGRISEPHFFLFYLKYVKSKCCKALGGISFIVGHMVLVCTPWSDSKTIGLSVVCLLTRVIIC